MTKPLKQVHLAAHFPGVNNTTVWSDPAAGSHIDFSSFVHLAQTAERARFDFFFLAEGLRLREQNGKIYDLEAHLDRFIRSAHNSKLTLPARDEMRDIIVRTAAASGKREGSIRYWASAGPGSLGLAPAAGAEPGFFVMISAGLGYPDTWYTQGLRMMTTTYPIKPPLYAVTKSVNGGTNGLEDRKRYLAKAKAIWIDASTPAAGNPTLHPGDHGGEVEDLQNALVEAGFQVVVDGDYGDNTKDAVMDFQTRHGLTADGVVGPRTWGLLKTSAA